MPWERVQREAHPLSLPGPTLGPPQPFRRPPMIGVSVPLDVVIVLSPWIALGVFWLLDG